jgi:hypothetical protein
MDALYHKLKSILWSTLWPVKALAAVQDWRKDKPATPNRRSNIAGRTTSFEELELLAKHGRGRLKQGGRNENVIRIEGRDRQYIDVSFGKRVKNAGQNANRGKLKLPFNREGPPAGLALYF